jgi:hypothetical protein
MTTLVNSPTLGLERVARECLIVLMETLNDELPAQDAIWAPLDEDLATRRGVVYEPVTLEPVEIQNFSLGHRPSLIEAPVEGYPNVSVMADRAGQSPYDEIDQMNNYQLRLFIECMVKSLKGEEEVNARVQRMTDAVNVCVMSNPTLRGVVYGIDGEPEIQFTEVFPRKERTSYGAEWFWQGSRIEYTVLKEATMPSGSFSRPATTGAPTNMPELEFDQS